MTDIKDLMSHSEAIGFFDYNPDTGWLIHKTRLTFNHQRRPGDRAGSLHRASGYRRVRYKGVDCKEHRLIWFLVTRLWPKDYIDHINGICDDNRWVNLRESNNMLNQQNQRKATAQNKSSGVLGVCKLSSKFSGYRYRAAIYVCNKNIALGTYDTLEEASRAYIEAKKIYHPHSVLADPSLLK